MQLSIRVRPNLDIIGVKFDKLTFEDHVCGIVSRVFQRIGSLRLVKRILGDTFVLPRWYYEFVLLILEYCSPVWGSAILNDIFIYSNVRCIRWSGFAMIRVFCCCVIDVMLLGYVCCKRLIQTWIIVYSVNLLLLLPEFDIASAVAHPWVWSQLIATGIEQL